MSASQGKRRHRKPWYVFTWRRFWIAYVVIITLVGTPGIWIAYHELTWPQKFRRYVSQLEAEVRSLQGASPERVVNALGLGRPEETAQSDNGRYLAMRWSTPFWHYQMELTFRSGGLEYYSILERGPYPHTGREGIDHITLVQVWAWGQHAVLMFAAVPWLLSLITAVFSRDNRRLCGHIMLASSIGWGLAGLAYQSVEWRRYNLLDPEDLAGWVGWLIPSVISVVVLIWAYRARPIQPFPACPRCRYNLTGNVSGICPECGTPVPDESQAPPPGATDHGISS